jgi:hypothetical protein
MAAKTQEPTRRVILKFWSHAVERTEAEIEELKAQRLFVRDATAADKLAPHDEAAKSRAASAAALAGAPAATPTTPPAASTPPGAKTDDKEKTP